MQKDVLFGLSQGTKVLQTIHREMGGLEGVEKLMGESEEARAYQEVCFIYISIFFSYFVLFNNAVWNILSSTVHFANTPAFQQEVSRMLGGQMSNQDEDEVEDELEAMEHAMEQAISGPVSLPDVPTSALPEEAEQEKQEKAKQRAKARARARAAVPMEA